MEEIDGSSEEFEKVLAVIMREESSAVLARGPSSFVAS